MQEQQVQEQGLSMSDTTSYDETTKDRRIMDGTPGCVQEVEGLFWCIRCNRKLKKKTSIHLH